jgi:hypothetical protein
VRRTLAAAGALILLAALAGDSRSSPTAEALRETLRVKMLAAHLNGPGAHVAVWLGVNDLRDWIQGGIEIEYGNAHPYVYFETGFFTATHAARQTAFTRRPTVFGRVTTLRLVTKGDYWQIVIDGRLIPTRIRLSHGKPRILSHVEILDGTVSASIDGIVQP